MRPVVNMLTYIPYLPIYKYILTVSRHMKVTALRATDTDNESNIHIKKSPQGINLKDSSLF